MIDMYRKYLVGLVVLCFTILIYPSMILSGHESEESNILQYDLLQTKSLNEVVEVLEQYISHINHISKDLKSPLISVYKDSVENMVSYRIMTTYKNAEIIYHKLDQYKLDHSSNYLLIVNTITSFDKGTRGSVTIFIKK